MGRDGFLDAADSAASDLPRSTHRAAAGIHATARPELFAAEDHDCHDDEHGDATTRDGGCVIDRDGPQP